MPKFEGSHEETFTLDVPIEKAKEHFSDLDTIIANYGNLERGEKVNEKTIHFVLEPKSAMGATFQGDYQVEYNFTSDNEFEWKSVGSGNMSAKGGITFKALDDDKTQLTYRQEMVVDMPINRLLSKAIAPIVSKNIRSGILDFLGNMRESLKKK